MAVRLPVRTDLLRLLPCSDDVSDFLRLLKPINLFWSPLQVRVKAASSTSYYSIQSVNSLYIMSFGHWMVANLQIITLGIMCWADLPSTYSSTVWTDCKNLHPKSQYTVLQSIKKKAPSIMNDSQPSSSPIICHWVNGKSFCWYTTSNFKFYLAVCQLKERRIFLTLSFILSDILRA